MKYSPPFFSTYLLPATRKATTARKKARSTAQRKVATGWIPIRPPMKALLLLFNRATMSGRMWSVFFSLKSCKSRTTCKNV